MLKTAMIFKSNMVLQRQKNIKLWGTDSPENSIKATLKGITIEGLADNQGNWMLTFPPFEAERNLELLITNGEETLKFNNICIGEVWIAGGQSNMEYYLQYDAEKESVLSKETNLDIRFFDYPEVSYEGQLQQYDYSKFGFWRLATKEDLPYFSAVGYYFADNLQNELEVPIGIVGCNWGGTPACAWLDPEYLKNNEGKAWIDSYEQSITALDIEKYKANFNSNPMNDRTNPFYDEMGNRLMYPGLSRDEQLGLVKMMSENPTTLVIPEPGPYYERRPGGLYETMLKKIASFSCRGVIWYQGESDDEKPELYSTVFTNLIKCWRTLWEDALPFLFVELAPFDKWLGIQTNNFPIVRSQQEFVSNTVPNTWMASSSDVGMQWDIHPKHKKPIGTRLSLLARGHIYGENILCDPPEFLNALRVPEGIRINFKNADGLYISGDVLNSLIIMDQARNQLHNPLQFFIIEDSLIIKGIFPEKTIIAFAMTSYYKVNLYNKMNNPVKPFEVLVK